VEEDIMKIAALITWLITASGGFSLLGTWIARGGLRQQQAGATRFAAPFVFGHFLLAAGLIVGIIYLAIGTTALAWAAFIILLPVALLGFTMFARWISVHRTPTAAPTPVTPAGTILAGPQPAASCQPAVPAERHLAVPVGSPRPARRRHPGARRGHRRRCRLTRINSRQH
jgi:predicted lipid-binding transport protein (Tim44 family)